MDLWIGNIPFETTEDTLRTVLERHVPVLGLRLIRDHLTKRSRGFGFVTVSEAEGVSILLELQPGAIKIGHRALLIRRAHKQLPNEPEPIRPGQKNYVLHQLSPEPYDLEPLDPQLPSGHILVDDIMLTILQDFSIDELIRLETVCRRWQGLIYRILGGYETIDFSSAGSPWGIISRRYSWHSKKHVQCLHKALILNSNSITSIYLDDLAMHDNCSPLNAIGQIAPNLELLSIKCIEQSGHLSLKGIVKGCPNLKHICIKGSFYGDSHVDDLKNCQFLESFSVCGTSQIDASRLEKLPNTLTEICLEEVYGSLIETFPSCIVRFSNLKKLKFFTEEAWIPCFAEMYASGISPLAHESVGRSRQMVTQEQLDQLADGCPLLENLQINVNTREDEAPNFTKFLNLKSLRVFSTKFNLKTFMLSCLPPVTDLRIKFKVMTTTVPGLDFSQAPSSIQSLTLNRLELMSKHYETILRHPGIKNLYIKNSDLSMEILKQIVSSLTLEEFGFHLDTDMDVSEVVKCLKEVRYEACKKSVKSGASTTTPPCLMLHVGMGETHDEDWDYFSSLNNEYLTVRGYFQRQFDRAGSLSILETDPDSLDDEDDDDDDESYFGAFDYEDYLGDSDIDEEGVLQFIHPINLLDDEDDKYLFGYGDPDYDGDYYLGHWD